MIVAEELSATALQEYVTPIHDINLDPLVIENLDDLAFHVRDGVVKIGVESMLGAAYVNKYLDAFTRDLWFALGFALGFALEFVFVFENPETRPPK